ncbi:MAG: hypothetical protein PHP75_03745 [Methylacidiphilaceae bacterium]|nr:hypothetical protein [Candidatus Methylacidiphilaceae bacterium]
MNMTVAAIIAGYPALALLASVKFGPSAFVLLAAGLLYTAGALYFYSWSLLQLIGYFLIKGANGIQTNPTTVERRCNRLMSAIVKPFSMLTLILLTLGYFVRAAFGTDIALSFAQVNITEDLAFASLVLLPPISSFALFLIIGLVYMADAARNVLRHGSGEEKGSTESPLQMVYALRRVVCELCNVLRHGPHTHKPSAEESFRRKYANLRSIVTDWNEWSLGRQNSDAAKVNWGIDIDWRFIRNQGIELLEVTFSSCVVALVAAVILAAVVFDGRPSTDEMWWLLIQVVWLCGLIGPMVFSAITIWFVLPDARRAAVLPLSVLTCVAFFIVFHVFNDLVDKVPQQFGGFRPEKCVACWKEGKRKDLVPPAYYKSADSPAVPEPSAAPGREDDAAPRKWEINVVYKTDKYLFLAPHDGDIRNAKSIMLSTDGLESLEPAHSEAAAPANKH